MNQPSAAKTARNQHAPMSSYCATIANAAEASGVNTPNRARAQYSDGANVVWSINADGSTAPTYGTDAEGRYVNGAVANTRGVLRDNSGGGTPIALTHGGFSLRFWMEAATSAADRPITQTGGSFTANSTFFFYRPANTSDLVGVFRDSSGTNHVLRVQDAGFGSNMTLVPVWGLYGCNFWLHHWNAAAGRWIITEASTVDGSPKLLTQGMTIPAAGRWWLNYNPGTGEHGGIRWYGMSRWVRNIARLTGDGPVRHWYVNDMLVDPFLTMRAIPSFDDLLWNNVIPVCGRCTRSSATFTTATADGFSGSVLVDVKISDDLANLDAASPLGAVEATTANSAVDLVVTLPRYDAGTTLYRQHRWSDDGGTTWTPFPAGFGRFRLQRTAGEYDVLDISDTHVTNTLDGGIPAANMGGDLDIILDGDGVLREDAGFGRRKMWATWCTYIDAMLSTDPDFIIWGHDAGMCNVASGTGDIQVEKFTAWAIALHCAAPMLKLGMVVVGLGNHEGEDQNNQSRSAAAIQKGSTVARKALIPNPRHDTYIEGGENWPRSEWVAPANDNATYVNDVAGVNASPLENAFAFTWGGGKCSTLWMFLDAGRYNTGGSGSWPYVPALSDAIYGASQIAWLEGVLSGTAARFRIVDVHSLPGGGFAGNTSGGHLYKRGGAALFGNVAYYAEAATVEPPQQVAFRNLLANHHATLKHHHDHLHWIGVGQGVTNVCAPTGGANSHAGASSDDNWSEFAQRSDLYGTAESGGTANSIGSPMPVVPLSYFNGIGFTVWQVREDGVYVKCRETVECTQAVGDAEDEIAKYSRPQLSGSRTFGPAFAKNGSHQINLRNDPLNPDALPRQVYAVFDASDVEFADSWWDSDYEDFSERNAGAVGSIAFAQEYGSGVVQLTSGAAASVKIKWAPRWVDRTKLPESGPTEVDEAERQKAAFVRRLRPQQSRMRRQ